MENQKEQAITPQMIIGEVIEKYPYLKDVMESYGYHCTGCDVNAFESLEQGHKAHGIPEETFNSMMDEINEMVAKKQAAGEKPVEVAAPKETNVQVSEFAGKKIKDIMGEANKAEAFLRLSAKPGGCAGFMYGMEVEETPRENDVHVTQHGIKFVIDPASAQALNGVSLDYTESFQSTGFKFSNPNAKSTCGCGKSFQ